MGLLRPGTFLMFINSASDDGTPLAAGRYSGSYCDGSREIDGVCDVPASVGAPRPPLKGPSGNAPFLGTDGSSGSWVFGGALVVVLGLALARARRPRDRFVGRC